MSPENIAEQKEPSEEKNGSNRGEKNLHNPMQDQSDESITSDTSFDAFKEAEENATSTDNIVKLESAVEEPIPVKKKNNMKKSSSKSGTVSIFISFIAIGLSGYSILEQKMVSQGMNEQLTNLTIEVERIPEIVSVQEEFVELKNKIESSTELQNLIDRTSQDLSITQKKLETLAGELDTTNVGQSLHSEEIKGIQDHLKKLNEKMKKFRKRPKITKAPKRRSKAAAKVPAIGDASLVSIDVWGGVAFAILKDTTGVLIPIARGDFYKNWELVSIGIRQVTFKKGRIKKSLQKEV